VHNFKLIVILTAIAAAVDFVWLGVVVKNFYQSQLGDLMRPAGVFGDIRLLGAVAVYLLLAAGIVFFVLPNAPTAATAIGWGAFLGLLVYGVYDFTNWTVLSRWPLVLALADIAWGVFILGFLSWLATHLSRILS